MKKNHPVMCAVLIGAAAVVTAVLLIEKGSKTPVERYLETKEFITSDPSDKVFVYNEKHTVKYEFLSYEIIEDTDIAKQTKYPGKYFYEGRLPDPDYLVEYTDYKAMCRDHPEVDEYISSNGKKGMTSSEYERFLEQHEAEYTTKKHPKTKYLFLHCKITNIGEGPVEEYVNSLVLMAMRDGKEAGFAEAGEYFDHPQHTEGEDRIHEFCLYVFSKSGDGLDCIIGFKLDEDYVDFSDKNVWYLGIRPSMNNGNDDFNPEVDGNFVKLASLPKGT